MRKDIPQPRGSRALATAAIFFHRLWPGVPALHRSRPLPNCSGEDASGGQRARPLESRHAMRPLQGHGSALTGCQGMSSLRSYRGDSCPLRPSWPGPGFLSAGLLSRMRDWERGDALLKSGSGRPRPRAGRRQAVVWRRRECAGSRAGRNGPKPWRRRFARPG